MADEKKDQIQKRNSPLDSLMHSVEQRRVSIEKALPAWMQQQRGAVDRFVLQVRMALAKNERLQKCDPKSVIESVMQAAELGLDPSGRLGSAYLVPYGQTCTLIPGYRGLIDLAVRSGEVASIQPFLVFEKDAFRYTAGEIPKHTPWIPRPDEDQSQGRVYAGWSLVQMARSVGGTK